MKADAATAQVDASAQGLSRVPAIASLPITQIDFGIDPVIPASVTIRFGVDDFELDLVRLGIGP